MTAATSSLCDCRNSVSQDDCQQKLGDVDLIIVLRSLTAVRLPWFSDPCTIVEAFQFPSLKYIIS